MERVASERREWFEVVTAHGAHWNLRRSRPDAEAEVRAVDRLWSEFAPHRIVRMVELRDDEQIVPKEG